MNNKQQKVFPWVIAGSALLLSFITLIGLLLTTDVRPIGPNNSVVGLSSINSFFFATFGPNETFDIISDALLLLACALAIFFAFLAVIEFARRRSLFRIDKDLLLLIVLYLVTALIYLAFEIVEINCRPILEDGVLESSFPSSHSMVMTAIFLSTAYEAHLRLKKASVRKLIIYLLIFIAVLSCTIRLLSGVHWFTDIIGGFLISASLVCFYIALVNIETENSKRPQHAR